MQVFCRELNTKINELQGKSKGAKKTVLGSGAATANTSMANNNFVEDEYAAMEAEIEEIK